MRKLKQILAVAALALCCSAAVKADTQAAAITGVKQVDDSTSSVRLACNADLGSEYYVLELSENGKDGWVIVDWDTDPNYLYTSNLAAGHTYYARVTGCSDYEFEGDTRIWEPCTDPSTPIEVVTAPGGNASATQANATKNSVSVTVSQLAGANYYKLTYNNALIGQGTSPTVTTNVNLNPGTGYWIHAYACRRANTGYIADGDYAYMTVKTLQPKISKNGFGITNSWFNIDSYTFGVANNYAYDGYHFQFLTTSGKVKKQYYTSGRTQSVSNLKGTYYQYRVRSYVNCGSKRVYSEWSDVRTFGIAKKVTGKAVKGRKLRINWSKISGASGYTVYASNKENSGYKKVKSLSAKKRNVTITKVRGKRIKKNKKYYIRIIPKAKKLGAADAYGYYSYRLVTR